MDEEEDTGEKEDIGDEAKLVLTTLGLG